MKIIGNLLLLAVTAAVISFFAAPAVAFLAIRSAADTADAQALGRLIDYPAVRQSLRPQLSGDPAALAPAPSFLEDPIGAVRRQFEQAAPSALLPQADSYLTPAALAALTRGEGRLSNQRAATPMTAEARANPLPSPVFWGVNRARLAVADQGGSRTVFTFERRGPFDWRLVHIGLPEGVSATAPASPQAPVAAPAPRALTAPRG